MLDSLGRGSKLSIEPRGVLSRATVTSWRTVRYFLEDLGVSRSLNQRLVMLSTWTGACWVPLPNDRDFGLRIVAQCVARCLTSPPSQWAIPSADIGLGSRRNGRTFETLGAV